MNGRRVRRQALAPAVATFLLLAVLALAPAAAGRSLAATSAALVRVAAPPEGSELQCDASSLRARTVEGGRGTDAAGGPRDEPRLALEPLPATDREARGRPRIAIWGDSHTAAGPFVEALLDAWGLPRATTRPSFIPPSFGQPNVRLHPVRSCVSGDWRWRTAFRQTTPGARFAKGLVALAGEAAGSVLAFDFRAVGQGARLRSVDLLFSKDEAERALVLGLRVNGGPEQMVFLHGGDISQLRVVAEVTPGTAVAIDTLHLRLVAGQVALEGLAPAYADAAAMPVVDVFSVPGATIAGWQRVDTRYLISREVDPIDYDLVLFQYGTNDAVARDFDPEGFGRAMRAALAHLREVAPRARCLVVGPPDRGASGRGGGVGGAESRRLSQLHAAVSAVQERVAGEFSCTFWNWQRAMGGPGAAQGWARNEPRLMRPDLIHLTADGYVQSARSLAAAFAPKGPR